MTLNAEFLALTFSAAFNPELIALDLFLIENRRPRAMFISILARGDRLGRHRDPLARPQPLSIAIAVGLVDVLVMQADTVNKQKSVSAGVDLAVGLILLALGLLFTSGILPRHRAEKDTKKAKSKGRAVTALSQPRLLLAFGIGALCGLRARPTSPLCNPSSPGTARRLREYWASWSSASSSSC